MNTPRKTEQCSWLVTGEDGDYVVKAFYASDAALFIGNRYTYVTAVKLAPANAFRLRNTRQITGLEAPVANKRVYTADQQPVSMASSMKTTKHSISIKAMVKHLTLAHDECVDLAENDKNPPPDRDKLYTDACARRKIAKEELLKLIADF